MKSLVVVFSFHHKNTEKIAEIIAKVLDGEVKSPQEVNLDEIQKYELVGFGSGIYSESLHKKILDLAEKLPLVSNKKAFIFSTSGIAEKKYNHKIIRKILQSKGYQIVDEFNCRGFNTNSFLRYFGGMNKGRPNEKDQKNAEEFAQKLLGI